MPFAAFLTTFSFASGNTTIGSETIDREEFLVVADQEDFMLIQKNNSEYVMNI